MCVRGRAPAYVAQTISTCVYILWLRLVSVWAAVRVISNSSSVHQKEQFSKVQNYETAACSGWQQQQFARGVRKYSDRVTKMADRLLPVTSAQSMMALLTCLLHTVMWGLEEEKSFRWFKEVNKSGCWNSWLFEWPHQRLQHWFPVVWRLLVTVSDEEVCVALVVSDSLSSVWGTA